MFVHHISAGSIECVYLHKIPLFEWNAIKIWKQTIFHYGIELLLKKLLMSQYAIANRKYYTQCLVFDQLFEVDTITNGLLFIKIRYSFLRCLYQKKCDSSMQQFFEIYLEPSRRAETLGKSRSCITSFSSSWLNSVSLWFLLHSYSETSVGTQKAFRQLTPTNCFLKLLQEMLVLGHLDNEGQVELQMVH